jgi:hypothetical protein
MLARDCRLKVHPAGRDTWCLIHEPGQADAYRLPVWRMLGCQPVSDQESTTHLAGIAYALLTYAASHTVAARWVLDYAAHLANRILPYGLVLRIADVQDWLRSMAADSPAGVPVPTKGPGRVNLAPVAASRSPRRQSRASTAAATAGDGALWNGEL